MADDNQAMTEDQAEDSEALAAEAAGEELDAAAEEALRQLRELQDEVEAAQARAAEYLDGWQRSQAEFSNYRKRQEADRSQMMVFANARLLGRLLEIGDDFERAKATQPVGLDELTWVNGLFIIKLKLDQILQSEGVRPIDTQGAVFDPLFHEAITYEEAEGLSEGQIIGEVQRGYMLGERVLRPALVRVAKAAAPPPAVPAGASVAPDAEESEAAADG